MPRRFCADCGQLYDKAASPTLRCPDCERKARRTRDRGRVRPSSTARGYGAEHRAERAARLAELEPGSPCVRCRHPMWPPADKVQLDHNADRTGYLGFSHGSPCQVCGKVCNSEAGGSATRH